MPSTLFTDEIGKTGMPAVTPKTKVLHRMLALAGVLAASACASTAQRTAPLDPRISLGGLVADRSATGNDWFNSRISLSGPFDRLHYQASYVVDGGDLLSRLDGSGTQPLLTRAPRDYSGEALRQSISATLPSLVGNAPQLSFSSLSGSRFNGVADTPQREQKALLDWSPAPFDLRLEWSAPRLISDLNKPLDCSLGGRLELGLDRFGADDQSLSLGARNCQVDSPDRLVGSLGVDNWSGAWQFGKTALRHQLSFSVLEVANTPLTAIDAGSGYELRLTQTRSAGSWTGESALSLRRVATIETGSGTTDWTAQAKLQRQIRDVALTAGWKRDADPLWFVPGIASPVDQLALGLDLRSWLAEQIGAANLLTAQLSYQWNQSRDPALDGSAVFWNLSKAW